MYEDKETVFPSFCPPVASVALAGCPGPADTGNALQAGDNLTEGTWVPDSRKHHPGLGRLELELLCERTVYVV